MQKHKQKDLLPAFQISNLYKNEKAKSTPAKQRHTMQKKEEKNQKQEVCSKKYSRSKQKIQKKNGSL